MLPRLCALPARLSLACAGLVLLSPLADAEVILPMILWVGPDKIHATPCSAIAAAHDGDTIEINGGVTYTGDVCTVRASNLVIRGVNGRPRIDAAGQSEGGKGTWVIAGSKVTVENVEMLGAASSDQNGAALRVEGRDFTLRQAFIHDNENGVLSGASPASDIVIENSEFGHNGNGSGYTHNVYIGNVRSLIFRYNYAHDAHGGHNLKSRARTNLVAYNRFSTTAPGEAGFSANARPSYEIDLPNAGTSQVIGNIIQQPAANGNSNILAYGEEGPSNPGQDLYVINNTFLNDYRGGGLFVMVGGQVAVPALIQNNLFGGNGVPTNQAGAILKNNYRAPAPAFADRAGYDLRPGPRAAFIDAGSVPGKAADGVELRPDKIYVHPASSASRRVDGRIDIGAYEAGQEAD